jgi:hypothetical protein
MPIQCSRQGGFEFLALLLKENRLFELRDNRLPTSVPARATNCLFINTAKLVLSLCPLFPEGSNERETLHQFVHFLPSSQLIARGKWRHVCLAIGFGTGSPVFEQRVSRTPNQHDSVP